MLKSFYNKIKNLSPYLVKIYLLIFGLGWIGLYLYFRFFVERPAYAFETLKSILTLKHYLSFFIFVSLHLILIFSMLYLLWRKKYPEEKKTFISKLVLVGSEISNKIIWEPLEYIHNQIAPIIPGSARFFLYLEHLWTRSKYGHPYFYTLIFLFNVLPKFLVASFFIIDIIFYNQIKYFFSSLILLLIPIIFNLFLKFFITFANKNAPVIKNFFTSIKYLGEEYNYEFIVKPEYVGVIDPAEEIKVLFQLGFIDSYGTQIKKDIAKITPYVTICTSFIYALGGIYRLIYFIY